MATHFKNSFRSTYVQKWSLLFALSTCGFIQVLYYAQPLWSVVVENQENQELYNGGVEAILTVLGASGALLAGVLKVDWKSKGEFVLTIVTVIQGLALLYMSKTNNIFICYACYVVVGALYHFIITIASSEIAKCIDDESFGLVFGINTFLALAFQTILTALVVNGGVGFALEPRDQYFVYGFFYLVSAGLFIFVGLMSYFMRSRNTTNNNI